MELKSKQVRYFLQRSIYFLTVLPSKRFSLDHYHLNHMRNFRTTFIEKSHELKLNSGNYYVRQFKPLARFIHHNHNNLVRTSVKQLCLSPYLFLFFLHPLELLEKSQTIHFFLYQIFFYLFSGTLYPPKVKATELSSLFAPAHPPAL